VIVIGIGGEPATGKSALMTGILSALGPGSEVRSGVIRGTAHLGSSVVVLGLYGEDAGPYPGTDRLSMAVQPRTLEYLRDRAAAGVTAALFEGDRLFNAKFLRACLEDFPGSKFLLLTASEPVKAARRVGRSDTKPSAFLEGRATKYANVCRFVPGVEVFPNETPGDLEALSARVLADLRAAGIPV
jgi:hypothetical protein